MTAPLVEKVVFDHTVEGLFFKGLPGLVTARMKDRLRAAGLDLDRKLVAAYPFDVWMNALKITAEEAFIGDPLDTAMFKVGETIIDGYTQTLMGKAMLGMMRVIGPKRTLQRAQHSFRGANNYTETKLTETGPNVFELWVNHVGPYPTFTAGILHAGVARAGAKNPKVEVVGFDGAGTGCTYRISWS